MEENISHTLYESVWKVHPHPNYIHTEKHEIGEMEIGFYTARQSQLWPAHQC